MANTLTDAQIDAAVEWWASKLRGPVKHSCLTDEGRRDPANRPAALAEVLAGIRRPQVSEGQVLLFSEHLRNALQGVPSRWFRFGVDYDPEIILQDALDAAEIGGPGATLPWKTMMSFDGGGVQVSEGYGAPWVDVLPQELARREGRFGEEGGSDG